MSEKPKAYGGRPQRETTVRNGARSVEGARSDFYGPRVTFAASARYAAPRMTTGMLPELRPRWKRGPQKRKYFCPSFAWPACVPRGTKATGGRKQEAGSRTQAGHATGRIRCSTWNKSVGPEGAAPHSALPALAASLQGNRFRIRSGPRSWLTSHMGLPPRGFLYKYGDLPRNGMEFPPLFIRAPIVARAVRLADETSS